MGTDSRCPQWVCPLHARVRLYTQNTISVLAVEVPAFCAVRRSHA